MNEIKDLDNAEKEEIWRTTVSVMRERLKSRLIEDEFEESSETKLYHGLKLTSSTNLLGKYTWICYCCETHEYLLLERSASVGRYSVQGKPIQPSFVLSGTMSFSNLIWCSGASALIGYTPQDDLVWLMTYDCVLRQMARNEFAIGRIFYEPATNEIILVGSDRATRYPLHDKEKTLHAWKTIRYADREQGLTWAIEQSSIIPQKTSSLRLAASCLTTLYILPLEPDKETPETVPVNFLARHVGASMAAITALYFHETSMWIITGDQKGNVTGWSLELECVLSCPAGHKDSIKEIISHPSICGFITTSEDNVLQVWSCNFRDKMESFEEIGEIWSVALNESTAALATLGEKLSCFNMHQLYVFYAPLTAPATNIFSTTNPMYPTRVIVSSADNVTRILSSPTGKQINVQILSKRFNIVDMAYSGNANTLYTIILDTGEILVSDTRTNPMTFKHVWLGNGSSAKCIVAYEHYEEIRDVRDRQNEKIFRAIRTCVIVGTSDGNLAEIEGNSGKRGYTCRAHDGPVTILHSSTNIESLVSTGNDNCINVWKIFSQAQIAFVLCYTLYNIIPITLISSMEQILCIVSSTDNSKCHQLIMYDLLKKNKINHHSSKDHKKEVLDIKCLERLNICATSSKDNTIRIWDQQNNLNKILEVNIYAIKITFSSLKGDIVFAAGKHLYKIPFESYLSAMYKNQVISQNIPEIEELPINENAGYRIYEDEFDRHIILHPTSSTPLGSLDPTSTTVTRLDLVMQEHVCEQYRYRDQVINAIKEGNIKATKLVASRALMNNDEWEKYLEGILDSSKSHKYAPKHNIWDAVEKVQNIQKFYNESALFRMIHGYSLERFPEPSLSLPAVVKESQAPVLGFLPNSVTFTTTKKVKPVATTRPIKKPVIKYQYPEKLFDQTEDSGPPSDTDITDTLSQILTQSDEV